MCRTPSDHAELHRPTPKAARDGSSSPSEAAVGDRGVLHVVPADSLGSDRPLQSRRDVLVRVGEWSSRRAGGCRRSDRSLACGRGVRPLARGEGDSPAAPGTASTPLRLVRSPAGEVRRVDARPRLRALGQTGIIVAVLWRTDRPCRRPRAATRFRPARAAVGGGHVRHALPVRPRHTDGLAAPAHHPLEAGRGVDRASLRNTSRRSLACPKSNHVRPAFALGVPR